MPHKRKSQHLLKPYAFDGLGCPLPHKRKKPTQDSNSRSQPHRCPLPHKRKKPTPQRINFFQKVRDGKKSHSLQRYFGKNMLDFFTVRVCTLFITITPLTSMLANSSGLPKKSFLCRTINCSETHVRHVLFRVQKNKEENIPPCSRYALQKADYASFSSAIFNAVT